MLAQSTALISLVAQLTGSGQDPMGDLQISAPSGSRGAVGRAKLQSELALHKGTFFDAVVKSMARRMVRRHQWNEVMESFCQQGCQARSIWNALEGTVGRKSWALSNIK